MVFYCLTIIYHIPHGRNDLEYHNNIVAHVKRSGFHPDYYWFEKDYVWALNVEYNHHAYGDSLRATTYGQLP